ncbi:MAG: hypothetical protein KTR27_02080 [Leptolyngbyaceae cyanobacterium MAG.088]|nr:hypothetical protein [Leptolyngbyaceae cyanobacterium MAG.088]
MSFLAALVILFISLWMCWAIDGIPHLFPSLWILPLWLWLGFGAIVLSWFMKDS